MRTIRFGLSSRARTSGRFLHAFEAKSQGTYISCESPRASFQGAFGEAMGSTEGYDGAGRFDNCARRLAG